MALSKNTPRDTRTGDFQTYNVAANVNIYQGAAVSLNATTGLANPLVAGEVFVGFAMNRVNNLGGVASANQIEVRRKGVVCDLAVTGVTASDGKGTKVYASDDSTFTTTVGSNTLVGKVRQFLANGRADVEFDSFVTAP